MGEQVSVWLKVLRVVPGLGVLECILLARYRFKLFLLKLMYRGRGQVLSSGLKVGQTQLLSPFKVTISHDSVFKNKDRDLEDWFVHFSGGEHQYFHCIWNERKWLTHPLTGEGFDPTYWPLAKGPRRGDIKWVWDASRMDWILKLMRFEALKQDGAARKLFWSTLDDWRIHNPANIGVNWTCAQECSIRLLNILWGAGFFGPESEEQARNLNQLLADLAERIEFATDYGRAQRNNHGLTEATALLAAALALPDHPRAGAWRAFSQVNFVRQFEDQFALDGSYILDSFSYHRQALRVATVWLKLMREAALPVPSLVVRRMEAAAIFLKNNMILSMEADKDVSRQGLVPNYGQTDGSNVFSFSSLSTFDYRPVAQLAYFAATGRRLFAPGPYDEDIFWYFSSERVFDTEPLESVRRQVCASAVDGGYYSFSTGKLSGFIRCHRIQRRPGHADMLHADLWYDGVNVLCDSGTYSYADPKGEQLRSTRSHNTISIDGLDQMTPFRRFLWLDWTWAERLLFRAEGNDADPVIKFSGRHRGYWRHPRKITHTRTVVARSQDVTVSDRLECRAKGEPFRATLRWNLAEEMTWHQDGEQIVGKSALGFMVVIFCRAAAIAETDSMGGVGVVLTDAPRSRIYGEISVGPVLLINVESAGDLEFLTQIQFSEMSIKEKMSL